MYNGKDLTTVVNRRIGSKLYHVRVIISILIYMTTHLTIFVSGVHNIAGKEWTLPL